MRSDNEKTITYKDEDGFIQTKTIVSEKSVVCTVGQSTNKPSNPDEVKIFSEQKQISGKVHYGEIKKSEYSKSNPNIVE